MDSTRHNRADRRAIRREQRTQSPLLSIPFRQLRNRLPPLEVISPEQVEQIHAASMHILENVGLKFLDAEALDLWQKAGAKVDQANQRVWLDRGLVLELVAQAPACFTWRARNPEHNLTIGGNAINFLPHAGMVFAANLDMGRRPGRLDDYEKLQKLVQMCNVLHLAGVILVEPHDVEVSFRHLHRQYLGYTLTDKVVLEAAHGRVIPTDALNI